MKSIFWVISLAFLVSSGSSWVKTLLYSGLQPQTSQKTTLQYQTQGHFCLHHPPMVFYSSCKDPLPFFIEHLIFAKQSKVWIFLRSYFFKNEFLISCPFLLSKLDSSMIKRDTHSEKKKSFSNVLITGESNLDESRDERNGQLIRGSFLKKYLLTKSIL